MDNEYNRLRVIEKTEDMVEEKVTPVYTRYTNPTYKSLLKFHHEKIGEKFSVKDLFR